MSDNPKSPLNLAQSLTNLNLGNLIQQVRSVGAQPRPTSTSPNTIANTNARALSTPRHVTNVQATVVKTSDQTSKVSVTFKRDPTDYYFSNAQVYVSGYKGNPAPVLVGSGQSPISFALENTGDPVSVTVQAVGNLGPAPLSTAPNTTLQLQKTNAATVPSNTGGIVYPGDATIFLNGTGQFSSVPSTVYKGLQYFPRMWIANSTGTGQLFGFVSEGSAGTPVPVAADGTNPAFIKRTSSSSASSQAGWSLNDQVVSLNNFAYYQWRGALGQTTNIRAWVGLYVAASGFTTFMSDTPGTAFIGFRYSTHAADTHWQCVCYNGTTSTIVDSGVAPTVQPTSQYFRMLYTGSAIQFYINDVLVATISTNLPTATTLLGYLIMADNVGLANAIVIYQAENIIAQVI